MDFEDFEPSELNQDPEAIFEAILEYLSLDNVTRITYEIVSRAHDESQNSEQYSRLRELLDGFEAGMVMAGVMKGELVREEGKEPFYIGDQLYRDWIAWKIVILCNITPYDPNEENNGNQNQESSSGE